MFNGQIERIANNIGAFIWIGFIAGICVGTEEWFEKQEFVRCYLDYADLNIDISSFSETVFFEHFAPNTLILLLIAIYILSALHRMVFGSLEREPREKSGTIYSLENFSSLLAIAWLGMMLGISIPAFVFEGVYSFLKFLLLALYPSIYLVEVTLLTSLLYCEGLHKPPEFLNDKAAWKAGTRLEGFFILILGFLMLTYHQQYNEMMNSFSTWVLAKL